MSTSRVFLSIAFVFIALAVIAPNVRMWKYGFSVFIPTSQSQPFDYPRGHDLYGLFNPGYKVIVGIGYDARPFATLYHNTKTRDGSLSRPVWSTR